MVKKTYFTVGPSAIYPNVDKWTQDFYNFGYASEYHRSPVFKCIYQHLIEQLSTLMNIPSTHSIFIASSGSEILERILQNCVQNASFHFINGAFSKKFYDYALRLGIHTNKFEAEYFDSEIPEIPEDAELICMTHNETSTGIKTKEEYIHAVKNRYPNKILAVDCVSSAPFVYLDFSNVDIAFFSSQKAFGLPAGLGIWIINNELAQNLADKNYSQNRSAHNILGDYISNYKTLQTPSTPNVLGMYLLGKVAQDMNHRNMDSLMIEMLEKKKYVQSLFEINDWVSLLHNHTYSSDTVIPVQLLKNQKDILDLLLKRNIICSSGYGPLSDSQLRISNFPANTWQDIEKLSNALK